MPESSERRLWPLPDSASDQGVLRERRDPKRTIWSNFLDTCRRKLLVCSYAEVNLAHQLFPDPPYESRQPGMY
jgi:hypothetical protein